MSRYIYTIRDKGDSAMNSSTYISKMYNRINDAPAGSAFIVSDFTDLMDYETAKKSIARLGKNGTIRRVMRGIYDKPKYSQLLKEIATPNPHTIAAALARNYNWTIFANGETALNLLGLSTQVPTNWSYISSGPYKSYSFDRVNLEFLHKADREITGMSEKTALVIQALMTLGKESINDTVMKKIRSRLNEKDKKLLLKEGRRTTAWIYSAIKAICER